MKNGKKYAIVIFAFLMGCVAAQLPEIYVPKLRAGQVAKKYEYRCIPTIISNFTSAKTRAEKLEEVANKFGAEGWRIKDEYSFGIVGTTATVCFERIIEIAQP